MAKHAAARHRRAKPKRYGLRRFIALGMASGFIVGGIVAVRYATGSHADLLGFISSSNSASASPTPTASLTPSASATPTQSPTPSPTPTVKWQQTVLVPGDRTCFNPKKVQLHQVPRASQCAKNDLDLGDAEIKPSSTRPKNIDPVLQARFDAAKAIAKKYANKELTITSGWRSLSTQEYLFNRAVKRNGSKAKALRWVALPEVSMHPWGLAIDVSYTTAGKDDAGWLEKNGAAFGLCRVYDNEWWHFEPAIAPGGICPDRKPDANWAVTPSPEPTN